MRISRGKASVILLAAATAAFPLTAAAQGWYPGQSVTWQDARSPYTPGDGAIAGGPGADPDPGAPMYVCRAMYRGSMTPGKWVKGNCNISYGGREYVMHQYQVAYGSAYWRRWNGSLNGLVQTGREADGSPLYSCRVHYYQPASRPSFPNTAPPSMPGPDMNPPPIPGPPSMPSIPNMPNMPNMPGMNWQSGRGNGGVDFGYQPGKIVNGNCDFPLGGQEIVQPPPFQALYAGGNGPYYPPDYPPNYPPSPAPAPPPEVGPSSVTWESEQAPFTPGAGAIMGGPGDGPTPGSPLYICRAGADGGLYPGKWIQGQCSISAGGRELKMNTYDVAFGSAVWGSYSGPTSNMIQGGFDSDQNPIFVCRVPHLRVVFKDRGSQPGKLVNGQCLVPYAGTEIVTNPPFQVLYSTAASEPPPGESPPAPAAQGQPSGGILVVFQSGTAAAGGKITIMNGSTGKTVTEALAPNLDLNHCISVLQQAAFEAGLQIQGQTGGLKIFGANNSVNINGASVSITQF